MRNLDIRILVEMNGLRYKEIARKMHISHEYLSRLMRRELSPENRERVLKAIRELTNGTE